MERNKRAQIDIDLNNKKLKFDDYSTNTKKFEDLANEIIYEVFDYLEITHAYDAFFDLNKRFQNLFLHSNLPIQVNISTMSKTSFERYHQNIITPNKHRINYLRLSNPFTVEMIFSPPCLITGFVQLETLILEHIHAKYLRHIFTHAIRLLNLKTLVLSLADIVEDPTTLFRTIFRLPKLKSCKVTYLVKNSEYPPFTCLFGLKSSSIEHLVINSYLRFDSLEDILGSLPNLRRLSIKTFVQDYEFDFTPYFYRSKYLKNVSLEFDGVPLHRLEKIMKNFFRPVEIFQLTIKSNSASFIADRWEELIRSYMPNLRIFDMNYKTSTDDSSTYHNLVERFKSPFWIEHGWFFTHQHVFPSFLEDGILYSTDPYRRRNYELCWPSVDQICPYVYENNLNSVKHVSLRSRETTGNPINYFPNATELTIGDHFNASNGSFATILQHILPLEQLTKLVFEVYRCSLEEIVDLLVCTPNLHTFKFYLPLINDNDWNLIKQNNNFRYVSKMNKIKNLQLCRWSRLKSIQMILRLFPRIEYLETGMDRKQIGQVIRYLLTTRNHRQRRLCFLRILKTPKICLKEIDRLIKSEELIDNYSIKHLNHDLYFWW